MPVEFEAKVLDVEVAAMGASILAEGGELLGEVGMRRYVYDVVVGDLSRWIRLRDNGDEVTLAVKEIAHDGIDGTTETEVVVGDFEVTHALLGRMGFKAKSYQETRRTSYLLAGARLEVDRWPLIPPYLEIEGDSREHVVQVAELLGIDESRLTGENTIKVYARYGIDLEAIADLRF